MNERFSGDFTDSDRVIIEGIYQMFMKDSEVRKFRKYAKDNNTEMFVRSLFPDTVVCQITSCSIDDTAISGRKSGAMKKRMKMLQCQSTVIFLSHPRQHHVFRRFIALIL